MAHPWLHIKIEDGHPSDRRCLVLDDENNVVGQLPMMGFQYRMQHPDASTVTVMFHADSGLINTPRT